MLRTNKISKFELKKIQNDELLRINFNCRWEKTNCLLGFVEIPVGGLYDSLRKLKKREENTCFSEWFNIMNLKNDEPLYVVGKTKVLMILIIL